MARSNEPPQPWKKRPTGDDPTGTGTVITWNQTTGENTISFRRAVLTNVPILNTFEATLLVPGATVGMLRVGNTWGIIGSWSIPGSVDFGSAATAAIAGAVAALGAKVVTATTAGNYSDTESAAGDSGFIADGTGVTFTTTTGKWVIVLTAQVEVAGYKSAARFGFSASGAQTLSASNDRSAMITDPDTGVIGTVAWSRGFTGAAGSITITPQFRLTTSPTFGATAIWSQRTVLVIAY